MEHALIKEPDLVAECINKMVNSCKIPVTAKTRIGFDNTETYEYLNNFVNKISEAGSKTIILHARKAILKGLTPKENLKIPKLNYQMVYDIKKNNKNLEIIINGGIVNTNQINQHLKFCDGVMIGRAIYQNPYLLADIENKIFNNNECSFKVRYSKKISRLCKRRSKKRNKSKPDYETYRWFISRAKWSK